MSSDGSSPFSVAEGAFDGCVGVFEGVLVVGGDELSRGAVSYGWCRGVDVVNGSAAFFLVLFVYLVSEERGGGEINGFFSGGASFRGDSSCNFVRAVREVVEPDSAA